MARPPRMPDRSEIALDELEDYDWVVNRIENPNPYNRHQQEAYAGTIPALRSTWYPMLASPSIAANCGRLARSVNKYVPGENQPGKPRHRGWWRPVDHELFDVVIGFEEPKNPGTFHAIQFLAEGGRVEVLEALHSGREEELTDEERRVVTFHRQLVHGILSDESWDWMEKRVGSERGMVEFVFLLLYIQMVHRLHQVLNGWSRVPGVHTHDDFGKMLRDYRDGRLKLPPPIYDTRIPEPPPNLRPAEDWIAPPSTWHAEAPR